MMTLGGTEFDPHGDHWLKLAGKGAKPGWVMPPPLARVVLALSGEARPTQSRQRAGTSRILRNRSGQSLAVA
ncbi:hypothetical protein [Cupriavidus pinatubonensis]|uniref:Uncharacterized protein n=1 Tax=Cupriavidus pinatubonensis TaxID=248026 RepID=A0ABN7Y937_9BURK|nr:hypothetical protein [Cupriavidus pinatubonensis]CAG9169847.1 hypothetical protein LMG23994_01693 [Cupriavidus pinatubonensis]